MDTAYSFSLVCNEFEQFNEHVKGWGTEFRPLSSSHSESIHVFQSYSGKTQVSYAYFDLAVDQRGMAPQETRNIAILPVGHPDLYWCGKHITGGQVLLFNESGEMDSISKQGFEVYSLSVPANWLDEILFTNPAIRVGQEEQIIRCENNKISHFYQQLSGLYRTLRSNSVTEAPYSELQDATVFEGLSSLLESASHNPYSVAKERRMKIFGDAIDYIHANRERITITQICYHVSTSERTLERIFKSAIGISPKQYLNRFLFQVARQQLLQSTPCSTKVITIAQQLGFSHMGQFSAAYRTYFGECPSDTLNRIKVR